MTWYERNRRSMPWRETRDPYRIWVSEIMLQQTRVDAVLPFYLRFVERFPTLESLAGADLDSVLRAWQGLGYYGRARNLHRAARELVADRGGRLPEESEALRSLPGVGPYTAAAIASLAFDEAVPVVDGNVLRVFARFFGIEEDVKKPRVRDDLAARLQPFMAGHSPGVFNQAMMELGALVCDPRRPACARCPLRAECVAHRDARTHELPRKSAAKRLPHYEVGVGVVWRRGQVLIGKRRADQMLGGLWEFPGGKRRPGESIEETTAREVAEETGLRVRVGNPYAVVKQTYSHFRITMTAFRCEAAAGARAHPRTTDELRWVPPRDLDRYAFPKASLRVIEAVRHEETASGSASREARKRPSTPPRSRSPA